MKSRFSSNTVHNTWIKFDRNDSTEPIKNWYCDCPQGGRVLGFCSHVTSVLVFLGVSQYDDSFMIQSHEVYYLIIVLMLKEIHEY